MADADGRGVASHVGIRLVAELADTAGVSAAFSEALAGLRERRSRHDPGRVLADTVDGFSELIAVLAEVVTALRPQCNGEFAGADELGGFG